MALLNKLIARHIPSHALATNSESFSSRSMESSSQLQIQGNGTAGSQEQPTKDRMRFMLFRECDTRGRKLLYDSAGRPPGSNRKQLQIMEDMIFGCAALNFTGDSYKMHDFSSDSWEGYRMMLTKIFLAQPISLPPQATKEHQSYISQVPSCTTDSGFTDQQGNFDSAGEISSFFSSFSSFAASPSVSAASVSRLTSSAATLTVPETAASATCRAASDSAVPRKARSRKTRLAFTVLFGNQANSGNEMDLRDLIFQNFSLVEEFLQQLQFRVLQAFYKGTQCVALLNDAFDEFQHNCANVWSLSRLTEPAWLALMKSSVITERFVVEFASLASEFDTKLSQFFFSTLLTAVLTYHVTWVHSFIKQKSMPEKCHNRILLWTRDVELAQRFLFVLSYFVRSPHALQLYDDTMAARNNETPRKKKVSSSSMEIKIGADSSNCKYPERPQQQQEASRVDNLSSTDSPSNKSENGLSSSRRHSQLPENLRYLREYFDARYATEKSGIQEEDIESFKNAIMRGSFQELSYYEKLNEGRISSPSSSNSPNFYVGSVPDNANNQQSNNNKPIANEAPVEIPSVVVVGENLNQKRVEAYLMWAYAKESSSEYVSGRILQSLNSDSLLWLENLRHNLLSAASLSGSEASCVIANIDTCELQVLTYEKKSEFPLRLKESWASVPMSGAVACLVESTQIMWDLSRDPQQCIDHLESRLESICQKSEELARTVISSISSWNVPRVTCLLGIEAQDLPLLLAACSVHSPHITQMVGLSPM